MKTLEAASNSQVIAPANPDSARYGRCGDSQYLKNMNWPGCRTPLMRDEEDSGACTNYPDCILD